RPAVRRRAPSAVPILVDDEKAMPVKPGRTHLDRLAARIRHLGTAGIRRERASGKAFCRYVTGVGTRHVAEGGIRRGKAIALGGGQMPGQWRLPGSAQ